MQNWLMANRVAATFWEFVFSIIGAYAKQSGRAYTIIEFSGNGPNGFSVNVEHLAMHTL